MNLSSFGIWSSDWNYCHTHIFQFRHFIWFSCKFFLFFSDFCQQFPLECHSIKWYWKLQLFRPICWILFSFHVIHFGPASLSKKKSKTKINQWDHTIFFLVCITLKSNDRTTFNIANSGIRHKWTVTVAASTLPLNIQCISQNRNWTHVKYSKNIIINFNVIESKCVGRVLARMSTANVTSLRLWTFFLYE